MQSDAPQPQPIGPAGLPPVPATSSVPQPTATPAAAGPALPPAVPEPAQPQPLSMADVAKQAKQLTAQYRQDPYRLSQALGQLKMSAQAAHYNVTPNSGGN